MTSMKGIDEIQIWGVGNADVVSEDCKSNNGTNAPRKTGSCRSSRARLPTSNRSLLHAGPGLPKLSLSVVPLNISFSRVLHSICQKELRAFTRDSPLHFGWRRVRYHLGDRFPKEPPAGHNGPDAPSEGPIHRIRKESMSCRFPSSWEKTPAPSTVAQHDSWLGDPRRAPYAEGCRGLDVAAKPRASYTRRARRTTQSG
jgi:hypothetical protein